MLVAFTAAAGPETTADWCEEERAFPPAETGVAFMTLFEGEEAMVRITATFAFAVGTVRALPVIAG